MQADVQSRVFPSERNCLVARGTTDHQAGRGKYAIPKRANHRSIDFA
jgi:hypothetical protein